MKLTRVLLITAAVTLVSVPGWADDKKEAEVHAEHHPAATAEQAATQPAAEQKTDSSAMMANLQENMKKMQETMQKIHAAKTTEERNALMKEHMTQMQDHMKMMQGMGTGSGMGNMAGMHGNAKGGMGMMGEGMQCGAGDMMGRMGMMQQMMEQMMDHMELQQSQDKK